MDPKEFLQVWILMSSFRFLQVPSGSFRFLQVFPEFLAAFRLKDFQSCWHWSHSELIWNKIQCLKHDFNLFFSQNIFTCVFFQSLFKTVNYEAYHWQFLAKSQNISKRAKITKERLISVLEIAKIFKKVLSMFT